MLVSDSRLYSRDLEHNRLPSTEREPMGIALAARLTPLLCDKQPSNPGLPGFRDSSLDVNHL